MAVLNPRCACALAVLSLTACELTRDPVAVALTEDRVSVHSVLLAGDTTARVLLSLVPATADPFNPFAAPEWIPVADAHVRLTAGADTLVLTVAADTTANPCFKGPLYNQSPARELRTGCYTAHVPGGIASGAVFGVVIDLPGRGTVRGQTTVPAPPAILEPQAGATLPESREGLADFRVQWTEVPEGHAAELRFAPRNAACVVYVTGSGFYSMERRVLVDTSSADVGATLQCTESVDPVPADIVLTAFDAAYSRYLEGLARNKPLSDAALGFTGPAIGVFGSAASARQPVWFSPDAAPDF